METKQHATQNKMGFNEEIKEEIRKYIDINENSRQHSKSMECSKAVLRKCAVIQATRKNLKHPNLTI